MRSRLVLLLVALLPACSDSAGPEVGPAAYAGTWRLSVARVEGCWPAFELMFTIGPDDTDSGTDEFINVDSNWWLPNASTRRDLTGNINWLRNDFLLLFWTRGTLSNRGQFAGTGPDSRMLSGTFSDPDNAFRNVVGSNFCTAPATATRTSGE